MLNDDCKFKVKKILFLGSDKDEFDKWKNGISEVANNESRKKADINLKIEINEDALEGLYGQVSHPIEIKKKGQKIVGRIIRHFCE